MTMNGILTIKRTILIRTLPYDEELDKFEIIPLDELLQIDILPFKMTKLVMLEVAYEGQRSSSYREASNELSKKLGYQISTSLVRSVTIFVGNLVYQNDLTNALKTQVLITNSIPFREKEKGELYILIDGAALNTRIEDKNGSSWRENKLGMSFASINVVKRGSSDKSGHVIRKKEYTAFVGSANEFAKFVYLIAVNQSYGKYAQTIILGDGATWIRTMCERLFPDAIQILDLYHLKENIYDFAKHIFKNKKAKYKPWAVMMIDYIMDHKLDKVFLELEKYDNIKLPVGVVNLNNYLNNNRDKINYKDYKAKGYFIGSGAIESANKTVLQRRLKQAGMRWSVETAQPILSLRAKVESGMWEHVKLLVMNL